MIRKVIDVSQHNGTIRWKNVKGKVDAVILRAGYRGYGADGTLAEDKLFRTNAAAASALNIPIGAYWLSQALNEKEALEEAAYLVKLLKPFRITYPVYLDSEYCEQNANGRGDQITKAQRTKNALAFLKAIAAAGYTAGLYCAENWFTAEIDGEAIRKAGYTIWCARLAGKPRIGDHDAWQYTWTAKVPGIPGDVDMSEFYRDFADADAKEPTYISNPKSLDEISKEVIVGKWGNGDERKKRLTAAGYDYVEIQKRVNAMLR
nr:MAG TPA: hypothetical protein [Caudoviricetes sp.]